MASTSAPDASAVAPASPATATQPMPAVTAPPPAAASAPEGRGVPAPGDRRGRPAIDVVLPGEDRNVLRLFKRWWEPAVVALLFGSMFAVVLFQNRTEADTAARLGPREGYHWAVSQYHIAFLKMGEELRLESIGREIATIEHESKVAALAERAAQLSALQNAQFFREVNGFKEAVEQIDAFQARVSALFAKPGFSREDAVVAKIEFDRMEPIFERLDNEVLAEESRKREAFEAQRQQRGIFSVLLAAAIAASGLFTIARSVFARRRTEAAERERRRSIAAEALALQAMKQAVAEKGDFLAATSHELKSPLQAITSTIDRLSVVLASQAPEDLRRLRRAAESMGRHLSDVLTLAKGDAGTLEMMPEPFEARDLIREVAEEYRHKAIAKGLNFSVRLPAQAIYVVADSARVAQVLDNLVSNAVKYTARGLITVQLEPYDAAAPDGGRLRFHVTDTGPGIPADFIPTMWRPYRRRAEVDSGGSSGIGLAIVHTLAKHLGGTISVNSELGSGTTFTVELPMPAACDDDEPSGAGGGRVLIVDDRVDVLDGLVWSARQLGYTTDRAESAAVAANMMAAQDYDVVLIDLEMPVKSGRQLASEIRRGREDGRNRHSTFIAISASPEARAVGQRWPFNGFQEKGCLDRRGMQKLLESHMPPRRG